MPLSPSTPSLRRSSGPEPQSPTLLTFSVSYTLHPKRQPLQLPPVLRSLSALCWSRTEPRITLAAVPAASVHVPHVARQGFGSAPALSLKALATPQVGTNAGRRVTTRRLSVLYDVSSSPSSTLVVVPGSPRIRRPTQFADFLPAIPGSGRATSKSLTDEPALPLSTSSPAARPAPKGKVLVDRVAASLSSGELMAIMGPSGAGKTTLLQCLALETSTAGGVISGTIELCGEPMTAALLKNKCASVEQSDSLWPFLTPYELCIYYAQLYGSQTSSTATLSSSSVVDVVEELLTSLGLSGCAHTRIGGSPLTPPGLSGGQRRRLSLAAVLLKKPALILLDEPTSGLDAAAAVGIMQYLKTQVCQGACAPGRSPPSVICTIHQPSSKIWATFDKVLILAQGGKLAYFGPAGKIRSYFERASGVTMDSSNSLPEYILDLVNKEFTAAQKVDALLAHWQEKDPQFLVDCEDDDGEEAVNDTETSRCDSASLIPLTPASSSTPRPLSLFAEFRILLPRQTTLLLRDPTLYLSRSVLFVVGLSTLSIIYLDTRDRLQTNVLAKSFLVLWHDAVPSMLAVLAVYGFGADAKMVKREVKGGAFHPMSHILVNSFLQIPFIFLLSLSCLAVSGYGIGKMNPGLNGQSFFLMLAMHASTLYCYECIAELCAVLIANPLISMLLYLVIWFSSFIFCGMLIAVDSVIWPFRILCYALPLGWSLRSLNGIEFRGTIWEDATFCPAADTPGCFYHKDEQGNVALPGWTCGQDGNALQCFGRTGEQILGTVHRNYSQINPADTVKMDLLICLGIALFCKILCVKIFERECAKEAKVVSPSEGSPKKIPSTSGACVYHERVQELTSVAVDGGERV